MTAATLTLTEFLLERIAEDEAVAHAAKREPDPLQWEAAHSADRAWRMDGPVDGPSGYASIVIDPARVLAQCAAHRAIVQRHGERVIPAYDDRPELLWCQCLHNHWPCPDLYALAQVYRGAPGWREEWAQ